MSYSHVAPPGWESRHSRVRLLLQGDRLTQFDIGKLERRRRQAVNRAVRSGLAVDTIARLDPHWEALRKIYMSTAARTGYGLAESYYREKEGEWRENLRREFALPGRDWFGVYHDRRLVAFLYSCLVGDTAVWLATKCDADYLQKDPNDLLWAQTIQHYRGRQDCSRIDAGWSIAEPASIDWRKASMGFERVDLPVFRVVSWAVRATGSVALSILRSAVGVVRDESRRGLGFKLRTIESRLHGLIEGG
jgi:hypothetical protein